MKPYHITALILFTGALVACDAKQNKSTGPSIGPQFWLYDITEYKETDFDVVRGLGGRWISARYEAKPEAVVDRAAKIHEIIEVFTSDGWTKETKPPSRYVLSKIHETAVNDLYFRRGARDDEPKGWFFSNVIHLSTDGRIICTYCQVGW